MRYRIFLGFCLYLCYLNSFWFSNLIILAFCAYLSNESLRRNSFYSRRLSYNLIRALDSFSSYLTCSWVVRSCSMVHLTISYWISWFDVFFLNCLDFCLKIREPLRFLNLFKSFRSVDENSVLFSFYLIKSAVITSSSSLPFNSWGYISCFFSFRDSCFSSAFDVCWFSKMVEVLSDLISTSLLIPNLIYFVFRQSKVLGVWHSALKLYFPS